RRVRRRCDQDQWPGGEAQGLRPRPSSADRDRRGFGEPVPVRAQPAVRRSARRAGAGPGVAGRRRQRAGHHRRGEEDRGVAGMNKPDSAQAKAVPAAKLYEVIRAPRVSEKTARLQEVSNQYAFEVARDATKADIKAAVEKLFDVKVEAVNVANVKGKNKSFRQR